MKNPTPLIRALLIACVGLAGAAQSRTLTIDDYFQIKQVSDPQVSPEGRWIAYSVNRHDLEEDKQISRIWMISPKGGDAIALTAQGESSSRPRWSPDGRYLAYISARSEAPAQVWTLFREGGEAVQITKTAQSVTSFEWSPDGKHMVLVLQDPTQAELDKQKQGKQYEEKTPPPWVIDRHQFKTDYVGYLDRRRTHLYVLNVQSGILSQITQGDFDDSEPVWSPDGKSIAFVSNRTSEPDKNYNTDIWVTDAFPGKSPADPKRITSNPGPDSSPAWRPDGQEIAHVSLIDVKAMLYATNHLAVTDSNGRSTSILTESLDRNISQPEYSLDGTQIYFLLEDSGEQHVAAVSPEGGAVTRIVAGQISVSAFEPLADAELLALYASAHQPAEIFSVNGGNATQVTHVNDAVLANLELGQVVEAQFPSADGTRIEGFFVKPPNFKNRKRYPTVLSIHGGPQAQYDYGFNFQAQLMAAAGYLVALPNPRGSTGYGQAFCLAIWQAWGDRDTQDVIAAVDYAIEQGWADADRLAVEGWSYGGMLTNHVITQTARFKAAATGASATLYVVNYGHDQYQRWWEQEFGAPWKAENRDIWERLSPFNQVEQISTPTLILGGEKDWNVPIINSEQLYLALKQLGVETQLVVYPGEFHGIDTPSNAKDLLGRYLAWFEKYLHN